MTLFRALPLLLLMSTQARASMQTVVNNSLVHSGIGFVLQQQFSLAQHKWVLSLEYDFQGHHTSVLDGLDVSLEQLTRELTVLRVHTSNPSFQEINNHIKDYLFFELDALKKSVLELREQVSDLLQTIRPQDAHSRVGRGLFNFGAETLRFLLGTAVDSEVVAVSEKVSRQGELQNSIFHLVNNQISVINSTALLATHTAQQLQKLANATDSILAQFEKLRMEYDLDLQELSRKLTASMAVNSAIRTIQNALHTEYSRLALFQQAWSLTSRGQLSNFLLPPQKFLIILQEIASNLPRGLELLAPANSDNLYSFYSFTAVVATLLVDSKLRIIADLPLKNQEYSFNLYRTISLYLRHENESMFTFINPESEYLGVSQDKQHFINLNSKELLNCRGSHFKICDSQFDIQKFPNIPCTAAAFLSMTSEVHKLCTYQVTTSAPFQYINAPGTNAWVFSIPHPVLAFVTCPLSATDLNGEVTTSQHRLTDSGILYLPEHCSAQIDGHHLVAKFIGATSIKYQQVAPIVLPKFCLPNTTSGRGHKSVLQAVKVMRESQTAPLSGVVSQALSSQSGISLNQIEALRSFSSDIAERLDAPFVLGHTNSAISGMSFTIAISLAVVFIYRFCVLRKTHAARDHADVSAVPLVLNTSKI